MIKSIGNKINKIKMWYKLNSMKKVIAISFTTIAALGMLIVGGILYMRFVQSTSRIVTENNITLIDQVNLNLDNYLRNMMKVSNTVYYKVIKDTNFSQEGISDELNLLYEANKDSLVSIGVFSQYGQVIEAQPIREVKKYSDPRQSQWFKEAIEKKENLHFSTPHVQKLFINPDYQYRWVVSLSRAVDITNNGTTSTGVLLVDMNFSGIEQFFKNTTLDNDSYIYIINSEGEIIYHPKQQLIYSNLISENNKIAATYEDGAHNESFNGENRLITVKTIGYTGWKIVCVTPVESITDNYTEMGIFLLFIVLLFITIIACSNIFVSSRITNPITKLEECVKKLEGGDQTVVIPIDGSYEVQHLSKSIKSMIEQMHRLMEEIVLQQEAKRKSELNALQAQINPHFLYNTLDSIVWMIENDNYDGAINMVTSLSRLFRISLSKGKNIIPLSNEIEHVKNYLNIQSIRYKNRFSYFIDCAEETKNINCIKLIIQPIVENSIKHGMEFMDGDGEIYIKSYIKNENLYIEVSDNGLGMSEEAAAGLLTNEKNTKGNGIGLKNVNERIKITFGKAYGLKISSELDEGTIIIIKLPANKIITDKKEVVTNAETE